MPLARRVPKHGFTNPFQARYSVVNLKSLANLGTIDEVTPQTLVDARLIKRKSQPVKILGHGDMNRPMVIQAHKFSKSAEEKITRAGGKVEILP